MLFRPVYPTRCTRCEQYSSTRARVHAFVISLRTNAFDAFLPLREPHSKVYAEEIFFLFFLFFLFFGTRFARAGGCHDLLEGERGQGIRLVVQ